jgi:PIN domain nuclease of toxin-antitoxin system
VVRLLLDTHILVWWADGSPRLRPDTLAQIVAADAIIVSVVSLWEAAVKISVGKLSFDLNRLVAGLPGRGIVLLPVETRHCERYAGLPLHHRDPFDRMLVAQALEEALTFVTADKRLGRYGATLLPGV